MVEDKYLVMGKFMEVLDEKPNINQRNINDWEKTVSEMVQYGILNQSYNTLMVQLIPEVPILMMQDHNGRESNCGK